MTSIFWTPMTPCMFGLATNQTSLSEAARTPRLKNILMAWSTTATRRRSRSMRCRLAESHPRSLRTSSSGSQRSHRSGMTRIPWLSSKSNPRASWKNLRLPLKRTNLMDTWTQPLTSSLTRSLRASGQRECWDSRKSTILLMRNSSRYLR